MTTTETEIKGLKVIYDFLSYDEEREIFNDLKENNPSMIPAYGRSKIMRYGARECYNNFIVSSILPDWVKKVAEKIIAAGIFKEIPAHATVNEYRAGDQIVAHIDSKESGEKIVALSFQGDAEMVLEKDGVKYYVPLPARTLVIMEGESRWGYTHAILPVTELRYSIVFRKCN